MSNDCGKISMCSDGVIELNDTGKIVICCTCDTSCANFPNSVQSLTDTFNQTYFQSGWTGATPPTSNIANNTLNYPTGTWVTAGSSSGNPGNLTVRTRTASGAGTFTMSIVADGCRPGADPTVNGGEYAWGVGLNTWFNETPNRNSGAFIQIKTEKDNQGNVEYSVIAVVREAYPGSYFGETVTELIAPSAILPVGGFDLAMDVVETSADLYTVRFYANSSSHLLSLSGQRFNLGGSTTALDGERCDMPVSFSTLGLDIIEAITNKERGTCESFSVTVS